MGSKLELYMPVAGKVIPIEEANDYLINGMVGGTGVCIIPDGDIFFAQFLVKSYLSPKI